MTGAGPPPRRPATGAARDPAAARRRGDLERPAHRRGLGRRAPRGGCHRAARPRLAAAPRPGAGRRAARHATARATRWSRARATRPAALRAAREAGDRALGNDDPAAAADTLRDALALWRGPPLADFATRSSRQGRSPAWRTCGWRRPSCVSRRSSARRHARLVGELQALVRAHPLRERLCGQLMLALYRDGRQAEALETYRAARAGWSTRSASSPARTCSELERRILAHDARLLLDRRPARAGRAILVLPAGDATIDALVALARDARCARRPRAGDRRARRRRPQLAARSGAAQRPCARQRRERGVTARMAAFSSPTRRRRGPACR